MKRTILRIPAVQFESGLSRSTIFQRIAGGTVDKAGESWRSSGGVAFR